MVMLCAALAVPVDDFFSGASSTRASLDLMSDIQGPPGMAAGPTADEYVPFDDLFQSFEQHTAAREAHPERTSVPRTTVADAPAAFHAAQGAAIRSTVLQRPLEGAAAYEAENAPGELLGVDPAAQDVGAPW